MTAIVRRITPRTLRVLEPSYRPISLFGEVEELAREMWDAWKPAAFANGLIPRMDMIEGKDALVVKTELAGIKKRDIDISIENDTLIVKAEKKRDKLAKEATYRVSERYYGHYLRSVLLPVPVDAENVSASLKGGVLEIRLPKAKETKSKRVEIKVK